MSEKQKVSINDKALGGVLALLLYANVMLTRASTIVMMMAIIVFVAFVCVLILLTDKRLLSEVAKSKFIKWILLVWGLFIIYGVNGKYKEAYSLQYHLISLVYIILFVILIYHTRRRFLDVISIAFAVDVFAFALHTIVENGGNILNLINGSNRVGMGGTGNVNTTAIVYIFIGIPLLYQLIEKKNKIYGIPLVIDLLFMLLAGSKKAIISIVVIGLVFLFNYSKNTSALLKKMVLLVVGSITILLVVYNVPVLHDNIWNRFEVMIKVLNAYDVNDQSSTSLRLTFITQALIHAWDKPVWGHGWGAFAHLYGYSSLYQENLYSHCNYTEILFSFGIVGLVIFYSFPFKLLKKIGHLDNDVKLFARLYIFVFLTIDIASVTCYDIILGYLAYMFVEYVICRNEVEIENV